MQPRNKTPRRPDEPKVIAISATRPQVSTHLIWALGAALLAYSWISFLLR
jgi:hypothetical protein